VLVHTSEEVATPVHIEHDSAFSVVILLARVIVTTHLNPLGLELYSLLSPLPPRAPINSVDASITELFN
jgi:hypothetical protein